MKKRVVIDWATNPEVFITKGKQRLKQTGWNVYLNDKDEFELELFNPTESSILAKIQMDGKYISSSGIVLRPGERVFLERFLDSNNKFIFSTYLIDENNPAASAAIQKNGNIKVEFFMESTNYNITWGSTGTFASPTVSPYYPFNSPTYTAHDGVTAGTYNVKSSNSVRSLLFDSCASPIETGRVEKGKQSDQKFTNVNTEFTSIPFHTVEWKILPISQKAFTAADIGVYCTECGAKRKKDTHKFCPHCGNKF